MSVQQSAPDSRLPGEKRYVEAVLGDEYDLDRGLFMDAGDSIAFYTGEEEIAELTYDSAQEQSLREALVEAVAGDEAAAAEAREALTSYDERLGVRVETEPESVAGIDTQ
ncbi:MAG: hypothetical protein SVU32_03870, partial [Candidatus Nanohaloarchaea archaeon]|nr:hypothetical protein [Candidatus Nanohaloarchaea archaeon]